MKHMPLCVGTIGVSEALASVATEVHKLRERVKKLEGLEEKGEPPSEPLQRIMDDLDYQI
jgi:hypothetical protein